MKGVLDEDQRGKTDRPGGEKGVSEVHLRQVIPLPARGTGGSGGGGTPGQKQARWVD